MVLRWGPPRWGQVISALGKFQNMHGGRGRGLQRDALGDIVPRLERTKNHPPQRSRGTQHRPRPAGRHPTSQQAPPTARQKQRLLWVGAGGPADRPPGAARRRPEPHTRGQKASLWWAGARGLLAPSQRLAPQGPHPSPGAVRCLVPQPRRDPQKPQRQRAVRWSMCGAESWRTLPSTEPRALATSGPSICPSDQQPSGPTTHSNFPSEAPAS